MLLKSVFSNVTRKVRVVFIVSSVICKVIHWSQVIWNNYNLFTGNCCPLPRPVMFCCCSGTGEGFWGLGTSSLFAEDITKKLLTAVKVPTLQLFVTG